VFSYNMLISDVLAREILDSRGNPTIEVEVLLKVALLAVQLFHPAHQPAKTKRLNCATATKAVTLVKVF
jgi:hypothetical protein